MTVTMTKEEANAFAGKIEYYLNRLNKEGSIPIIVLTPSESISMGITDGLDNLPNPVVIYAEPLQKSFSESFKRAQYMAQLIGAIIVTTVDLEDEESIYHYNMMNVPVLYFNLDESEVKQAAILYKKSQNASEGYSTEDLMSIIITNSILEQADVWTENLKELHKGLEKPITEIRDNLVQLFRG